MPGSDDKNREELIGKLKTLSDKRSETPEQMFHAYDRDGSGGLNAAELEKLLTDAKVGNGITRGSWVNGIFEKVDKDRDKKLTLAELASVIESGQPPPPPATPKVKPPPMGPPRPPMGPPAPPADVASSAGDWLWIALLGGLVWMASRG